MMRIFIIITLSLVFCTVAQGQYDVKNNSISVWSSAEYGADLQSAESSEQFRDGFFHSAGFYYRHDFDRWYIRPGICYNQMMLTNKTIIEPAYTVKIHRLGLSFSGGYYLLDNPKFRIGLGCGVEGFYNIAAIYWEGSFRETKVVHLNRSDMFSWGVEFGAHAMFIYRLNNNFEIFVSPFVNLNALPTVRPAMDITMRTGASFGVGYLF